MATTNIWVELNELWQRYPEYDKEAHFRYAQWLAENDNFEEAQKGTYIYKF